MWYCEASTTRNLQTAGYDTWYCEASTTRNLQTAGYDTWRGTSTRWRWSSPSSFEHRHKPTHQTSTTSSRHHDTVTMTTTRQLHQQHQAALQRAAANQRPMRAATHQTPTKRRYALPVRTGRTHGPCVVRTARMYGYSACRR